MLNQKLTKLKHIALQIRLDTLRIIYEAGSGHLGSAMSVIELLTALYFSGILKYNSDKPNCLSRDYFLLSNGHACPALYCVLARAGFFTKDKLENNLFEGGT